MARSNRTCQVDRQFIISTIELGHAVPLRHPIGPAVRRQVSIPTPRMFTATSSPTAYVLVLRSTRSAINYFSGSASNHVSIRAAEHDTPLPVPSKKPPGLCRSVVCPLSKSNVRRISFHSMHPNPKLSSVQRLNKLLRQIK